MSAAKLKILGATTVVAFALSACNGNDDPVAPPIIQDGTIHFVHALPPADVGEELTLPLDVRVGAECAITNVGFGSTGESADFQPGTFDVEVRMADAANPCGGDIIGTSAAVQVGAGQSISVVAHLTPAGQPTVSRFVNDLAAVQGARVTARHVAAAGPVDVFVDDEAAITNLSNPQQQSAVVAPGTYTIGIAPTGETEVIFEQDVTVTANTVYLAYAVGSVENETFGVIVHQLPMTP